MAPIKNAAPPPHFVLVPHAGQGHLIPMVDLARLLASRCARVSFVTTPLTAERLRGVADRAAHDGLALEIVALPFSAADAAGLPVDCENTDRLTDNAQFLPFVNSMRALAAPFESFLRSLSPPARPCCIVSDGSNPWTVEPARRLGVPRLFFHGVSCFYSLCDLNSAEHGLHDKLLAADADDEKTSHVIPGMPVRVEVTRDTCPGYLLEEGWVVLHNEAIDAMRTADGVVINTFTDLEPQFVAAYEKALGGDKPVWTLGPLFLDNRDDDDALSAVRHDVAIDAWLDGQALRSVVYVNFGSLARKLPAQLFEVGHGLEDSGKPFLWVVKESEVASPEVQGWLDAFVARTATRGIVVRGWAPQVAILSHRAVGGFVTHCGWNSLLEAIAHGVPVVTWPHFADQFLNERLVVDVLGVGVPIGVTRPVLILDDESATVTRRDVVRAVSALMDGGEEADERRRKAMEYGERARRAMARGGSSYENMTRLIESFTRVEGKKPY